MQFPASPVRRFLTLMVKDALDASHAANALRRSVHKHGDVLTVGSRRYDLRDYRRVVVVGAGKAAAHMAVAIERTLGRHVHGGLVIVKYGHGVRTARVSVAEAGHPVPDRAGVAAARRIRALVVSLTDKDLLVVLLSGGASSLMPVPASGLTLADKQQVTGQLLRSGAGIAEINTVRKHLSDLKGGRLAASTNATIISLVLSDVIGDDLSVIASGPTFADVSTYHQAVDCLRRRRLWSSVPRSVRAHLTRGVSGRLEDTPKPAAHLFRRVHHEIIGNNETALAALTSRARSMGMRTVRLAPFTKEARAAAVSFVKAARHVLTKQGSASTPCCVIAGGETTVTVTGSGKGGRAQEFAVAAAKAIEGLPGVYVAAIGTDGTDGPTDVAGALVDGGTWSRARRMGIDLDAALSHNDTYRALKRLRCHIITGPTGTNVNDLYLLFLF